MPSFGASRSRGSAEPVSILKLGGKRFTGSWVNDSVMDGHRERDAACAHLEYDPGSGTYRVPFDPSGPRSVAEVVVASVAAVRDVEPTALPPVHDVVDPEALDRIVASAGPGATNVGSHQGRLVVAFPYVDYEVAVFPDEVRLRPEGGES